MTKQISERRSRSRACSNLNVNFNGGGVVLLLGAAAGALLASAFAAHRIRSHRRRRGSKAEGDSGDSGEHLVSQEEKESVGIGGPGDGADAGEGVVQVNSDDNLDVSLQISEVDQRGLGFYLMEEGKGEVAERSPTIDIELVDGEGGELAGFRESIADISSSATNSSRNLGENQLRYDDKESVAAGVKEECKTSCIIRKEDDEEDDKKAYIEEWGVREEIEGKKTSSNVYSEQSRPLEADTFDDLHASPKILDFVKRESDIYLVEKAAERSPAKENQLVDGVEELACLGGSTAKIGSSPANICSNLRIGSNFGEDQLRYDDEQLVADSVREDSKTPCIYSKEDEEEDNKKAYIEELGERRELEEKITPNLNTEELCLLEKNAFQILEMVIAIEERIFEDGFKDEMYNSILEFVLSKAKEMAKSSPFGDQDEMNPLIEKIEPFLEGSDEAKTALKITQNDSGKHPEMMIMEDKIRMESCSFKDAVRLDILCVEQDNKEGDSSDDKLVEGSRCLCEQTVALPHESSVRAISEPEIEEDKKEVEESNYPSAGVEGLINEIQGIAHPPIGSPLMEEGWPTQSCICDNTAMIMVIEEKIQLEDNATCDFNDFIQEEKTEKNLLNGFTENVESSETEENLRENEECLLIESQGIELSLEYLGTTYPPIGSPLKEEGWPIESCIRGNPAMIVAVDEKIQLKDNATCDLNDVIQEEKTGKNLLNGFKENMELSEMEENLGENEECPLTESQGIEFSLERDNLMAYKEGHLIQFQGMEPIVREEKACLEDCFSLSPELNMKTVQTIQDNNLNKSEKILEIEECHLEAGAKELGTSSNEGVEKREDETISVQYHELETSQYIEADKDKRADKLENEIEYLQILSVVKKGVGEILKESQAQIKEEEENEQIAKLAIDVVEKGVKTVAKTIKKDTMKHQHQVEGHEIEFSLEYLGTTHPPIGSPLKEEGWPTESCIGDNPTMIMAVEKNIQLEDNATCDLNVVIQKEKAKENLLNRFKENVESSKTEKNLRESEECPLTESQGVEFSLEYLGTSHPPIGSPLKEEGWRTESCIRGNPAMIMEIDEKIQLEDNATCDLNNVMQEEKTGKNLLNGFNENVELSEMEENFGENEECPLTESQGIKFSLERDNPMAYKGHLIQFQGMEPIVREEKACLEDSFSLSPELNMEKVQTIQDNNLNNYEKTLEIEECHLEAGAKELGTSPNEGVEKREDETISVQYHELETSQYIEADKDKRADKLENEIEYPQTLSVVKNGVGEIHKESQAQIKEEEEEEENEQIAKLPLDVLEKGVKIVAKTIKKDAMKHQRQVEGHEKNVSCEGKQQRRTTKKVKGTEYMFMGYPKGHIYLVITLAAAFAVLAFLYTKGFITRITILENFVTG